MKSHFCLCWDDWFKNFTHSAIVCLQVLYSEESEGERGGREGRGKGGVGERRGG